MADRSMVLMNGAGASLRSRTVAPMTAMNFGGRALPPPLRCTISRSSNHVTTFVSSVSNCPSIQSRTITRPPEPDMVMA